MVALQAANNETGVLHPLAEISRVLAPHRAALVCDAVQAIGRTVDLPRAGILFLSAHKLGGPKGAGAVVLAGDDMAPEALLKGGGQERGQRSGTENVAAIAGFAAALEAAMESRHAAIRTTRGLRDALEGGLRAVRSDTVVFGAEAPRLPNTTCFAVPGVSAETALVALDLAGVAVSSGAACSSGKVAASHVLAAMGHPPGLARGALRVSTGSATTARDVEVFLDAWRTFLHRRADRAVA
jgi:cysteine desulfurase